MPKTKFQQLLDCGQSLWIDHLDREMLDSGELKRRVEQEGLRGMTSNPTIFEKAINGNESYRPDIEKGIHQGLSAKEIYETLAFEDIRRACDGLRPIYEQSNGLDGYVSMEVSPHLSRDLAGTLAEARRFYQEIDRDNLMIKIPGTSEGMAAIEQCICEGINVNVTLLFSVDMYEQAAWAYLRGLEKRVNQGKPIDTIGSVASFFLSRIDVKIDDQLDERLKRQGTETLNEESRLNALKGKIAIANAKMAYQKYLEIIGSDRWQALQKQGANVQRLLWASTSTKDPSYSDVMYVDELIGRDTVNTMPPQTIEAFNDHGQVECDRITQNLDAAHHLIASLSDDDVTIDLDRVMDELLKEGIDKFIQPYDALLKSIEDKMQQLAPA